MTAERERDLQDWLDEWFSGFPFDAPSGLGKSIYAEHIEPLRRELADARERHAATERDACRWAERYDGAEKKLSGYRAEHIRIVESMEVDTAFARTERDKQIVRAETAERANAAAQARIAELEGALRDAIETMNDVRIFATSAERLRRPEGHEWFDSKIERARVVLGKEGEADG